MATMERTQPGHAGDGVLRAFAVGAGVIALTLSVSNNATAQTIDDVRLRVGHINNFSAGYDRSRHTYDADWFRNAVTDPPSRQIVAHVCRSLPAARIVVASVEDGKDCPDVDVRLAPEGASAFVWTLTGRDPQLNRVVQLKQERKLLHPYKAPAGSRCIALDTRKIAQTECEVTWAAPTPPREVAGAVDS